MEELPCITPQAGGSAVALTAARQECQCWGSREGREEGRVCVRVTELVMTLGWPSDGDGGQGQEGNL